MIEVNKVWKHCTGLQDIEANPKHKVFILCEGKKGFRYISKAFYKNKWTPLGSIRGKRVIGYYEVDDIVRCRAKVGCAIESIPKEFVGYALVLWEHGRNTIDGWESFGAFLSVGRVFKSCIFYMNDPLFKEPDYVIGYHLLPDKYHGIFDDGVSLLSDNEK